MNLYCFWIVKVWFNIYSESDFIIIALNMYKEILLLIIVFIFVVLVIWYNVYMIMSLVSPGKRAPFVSSFDSDLKLIKWLNLTKWKKIVDLWCGSAKALRFFESEFALLWDGYDINFFAIIWGLFWNKIKKSKVNLYWKNFFEADLKKYDYVYIFLLPKQLAYIESRLFKNIKDDCVVISSSFEFKKNKPYKIVSNQNWRSRIYLYRRSKENI